MKIPYFCCIGAELKRYEKDFDFMNQVYLYKIPADDTLEDVLAQDYFQAIANAVLQDDLLYIYEPTAQVLHTCRFNKQNGHITAVQLANNVPSLTPNRVLISDSAGHITAGDVTLEYLKNKVDLDGTSIMTGPLKMRSSVSFKCAIAPSWDGVGFYKLNDNNSLTLMASMEATDGLCPATNNTYNMGKASHKWKDAYIARVITAVINNGSDIAVPVTNSPDTLALKSEVELAANSGRMITDQGVWFAKMYAATVPPAADDNTNYADFSQTDGEGNPIIVLYERQSGAWVQTQTITPPANYDGYVPITSKIWDIAEQTGQQGGRVLWNHQSKEFTPYPNIVSFEDAALTGTPTAPTPTNASPDNQIATKEYVDNANPSGAYHPGLFAHEWDDHLRNDVSWLRADTFSWQLRSAYKPAYKALFDDIYEHTVWTAAGESDVRTNTYTPAVGDEVYLDSSPDTVVGTVTAFDELNNQISVSDGSTYTFGNNTFVTPVSETVAGYTVSVYTGHSGRKIVSASDEADVAAIYTATGVAWYYIIDTVNERFKLPRTNPSRQLLSQKAPVVGTTKAMLIVDATSQSLTSPDCNMINTTSGLNKNSGTSYQGVNITTDTTKTTVIADLTAATGVYSGKKYLYFYVGEFTQTAIENTAGLNAELFNDKVDVGHEVIAFQAPTAENNYTWYRKYADGWVEQGGWAQGNNIAFPITLPVTMSDSYYTICGIPDNNTGISGGYIMVDAGTQTSTGFTLVINFSGTAPATKTCRWQVSGMSAS